MEVVFRKVSNRELEQSQGLLKFTSGESLCSFLWLG